MVATKPDFGSDAEAAAFYRRIAGFTAPFEAESFDLAVVEDAVALGGLGEVVALDVPAGEHQRGVGHQPLHVGVLALYHPPHDAPSGFVADVAGRGGYKHPARSTARAPAGSRRVHTR